MNPTEGPSESREDCKIPSKHLRAPFKKELIGLKDMLIVGFEVLHGLPCI
jgi:hypothetical protein